MDILNTKGLIALIKSPWLGWRFPLARDKRAFCVPDALRRTDQRLGRSVRAAKLKSPLMLRASQFSFALGIA